MSDFLLDLRDAAIRRTAAARATAMLTFCDDTKVQLFERDRFTLVLTRVDDPGRWGSFSRLSGRHEIIVALCGRIALEPEQWDAAGNVEGSGGRACKAIFNLYRQGGIDALGGLNGNFVVLIFDEAASKLHLVSDRCGMCLAYCGRGGGTEPVYGSHPDVVASVLGEDQQLDTTSLAEFLMTGRLTFPHTYYRKIRGIGPGCIHTLDLRTGATARETTRRYGPLDFKIDERATEQELAEELARAFASAVRRRTTSTLGKTAVALSGGLDSRAILAAAGDRSQVVAFNLFDEENAESTIARRLARACGVDMIPFRRDFDYYGNAAEEGVRISGGTGNVASNHFLGIRGRLAQLGIQNLLTGCYCDYLFKGLVLNTAEQRLNRIERLADFNFKFYHPCYWAPTPHREDVEARLRARFPESSKSRLSEEDWLSIQRQRTFPLAYEGDLAQRVIPQRVMPWYLPIADNDVIDVYLKIPSRYKLNASVFRKMVALLCDRDICRIPDSNTGAPVGASGPRYTFHRYLSALRNRITEKVVPRMATRGSWPNWEYYIRHSQVIQSLWTRRNDVARDLFVRVLGSDPFKQPLHAYRGRQVEFFLRLFTQKLWLDQRFSPTPPRSQHETASKREPRKPEWASAA